MTSDDALFLSPVHHHQDGTILRFGLLMGGGIPRGRFGQTKLFYDFPFRAWSSDSYVCVNSIIQLNSYVVHTSTLSLCIVSWWWCIVRFFFILQCRKGCHDLRLAFHSTATKLWGFFGRAVSFFSSWNMVLLIRGNARPPPQKGIWMDVGRIGERHRTTLVGIVR